MSRSDAWLILAALFSAVGIAHAETGGIKALAGFVALCVVVFAIVDLALNQ